MNVSFIISIDNTYAMADNFFDQFLNHDFVQNSEVVVVIDGNQNIKIHSMVKTLSVKHHNFKVINSPKVGYGKANNIGVYNSSGEYLFFINVDVFVEKGCFEIMLDALQNNVADCVQPLLIYPQSNLVQCAGTFFGPYFKEHLFDGNKIDAPIVNCDGPRKALTSALYAMKKSTFEEFNGFDEFYYNKLESFELSYKIFLSGKKCWYLSKARAWHSRGGGRSQYTFDFTQQEAYFWSRYGNTITPDMAEYLKLQLKVPMLNKCYYAVAISQIRSWNEIISNVGIECSSIYDMPWVGPECFNLWNVLPSSALRLSEPLLLIIENVKYLRSNKYWFEVRDNPDDIAIDRSANLVNIKEYLL